MRRYSAREQTSLPRSMQMFFSNCCCLWRQLLCANVYKESSVQKFPWCCARALLHVSIIISSMLCLTIPRSVLSLDIKPWEAGIFFYVCALDGLFWDRQFVLLFRISKIEKLLDKFKCWKATSFFCGGLISSPLGWLLSQFGNLALKSPCFLPGILWFSQDVLLVLTFSTWRCHL